jgi:transcription-repair coupling factor (superfamily II helicase)
MLSRFRSQREQRDVLKELAHGMVDICIGTHRLLQKDVAFKDLGLVIIDEEQRFGVVHKERLKKMRKEVDVLTLTATPIPRTLHMSLIDVRDMSTMETPPEERLPIKIYVGQYDEKLVRGAILRELERNGQVFLVHNRVQTISRIANEVAKLVPEARRAIAHGQMPEEELERVMLDFSSGEIDVLVCTTIIESGLDIPNANTIVVNDSDMMGLAQLYQLRGRVGRGANRAYAYFLYAKEKYLTPAAQKRLETISRASELGAGFYIAMKDLEIRGAGSLLGTEQSGHIAAVGFDLYCQLLAEAVEELKAEKTPSIAPQLQMPTVDLLLRAHIPEDYIPQEQTRLSLYRRLAQLKSPEQVEEMEEEFRDRFGKLPAEVKNLLYTVKVKTLAAGAGISSISTQKRHILLKAADGIKLEPSQLANIHRPGIKIDSDQIKLDRSLLGNEWQAALEEILKKLPSACLPSPAAGV